MKNIIIVIVLLALLASCQRNNLDKQARKVYLKEHVQNANYLINTHFSHFQQHKVVNKENNNYQKLEKVIDACYEFQDYLNKHLYFHIDSGLTQKDWDMTLEKQSKITYQIDSIASPFLLRIARKYTLEKIENNDSDELKVAKYFSNCEKFTHQIFNAIEYTKNYHERKFSDFFSLMTINDTIQLGDTLKTVGGICLQEDIRNTIIIQKMNDCKLTDIKFKTGKFNLEITGLKPYISFAYYNSFSREDMTHEIIF